MKAEIEWIGEERFRARTDSGVEFEMDSKLPGPTPMQYVLASLGGCSSIDVVMILKKARQAISDCRCELEAERAESSPRVFTRIHARFLVEGRDLSEKQVRRAAALSFEKYCSVARMLVGNVELSHSVEIRGS